ncbi:hypothetical protein K8S19_12470 [bacterium]|nr:hypothetical protein [bacterium]
MMKRSMRITGMISFLLIASFNQSFASYLNVDILGTTTCATLTNLNLGAYNAPPELSIMPFYFRVSFPPNNNTNWGIELYSNIQPRLSTQPSDGIYRGLRGVVDVDNRVPFYWQVYPYDLNVCASYGTPQSVTATAGGLGFYTNTLRYWSEVYDISDVDRIPTWDNDRNNRVVVSVDGLGNYPALDRANTNPPIYLYFAGDLRNINSQQYIGQLRMDLFVYPFNYNTGCYVTPNPVKPALGQRAYFNFYTNSSDSNITIKIFDPTGFPVVTLRNTRYWDCRNSNYQYVEGGLYLYQIEVEGHRISGTLVVIK